MEDVRSICKIDSLGRICIPRGIREEFGVSDGDAMEVYTENGKVILKKYNGTINAKRAIKATMQFVAKDNDLCFDLRCQIVGRLNEVLSLLDEEKADDWRKEYWDNDGILYRDLNREDDGTPIEYINRYEIVFSVGGTTRYCFVDAVSMNEALGSFFRNHNGVAYSNIVEHLEI